MHIHFGAAQLKGLHKKALEMPTAVTGNQWCSRATPRDLDAIDRALLVNYHCSTKGWVLEPRKYSQEDIAAMC